MRIWQGAFARRADKQGGETSIGSSGPEPNGVVWSSSRRFGAHTPKRSTNPIRIAPSGEHAAWPEPPRAGDRAIAREWRPRKAIGGVHAVPPANDAGGRASGGVYRGREGDRQKTSGAPP